jgi:hypothetical protein
MGTDVDLIERNTGRAPAGASGVIGERLITSAA